MTQPKATVLDEIVKIYKNSTGKVIGLHTISIIEHRQSNPNHIPGKVNTDRFSRTGKVAHTFTRFNLDMSGSRVIDEILMLGKYDDFTMDLNETDIVEVVYDGDDSTNGLVIDLRSFPTVGDTI